MFVKYVENPVSSVTSAHSSGPAPNEITILDSLPLVDAYGSSRKQQVRNARTIMYVFSITNRESFEALEYLIGTVDSFCDGNPPPFVIVATNTDNYDHCQVDPSEGFDLSARTGSLGFFETCAPFGMNVPEAFALLIDQALEIRNMSDAGFAGIQNCGDSTLNDVKSEQHVRSQKVYTHRKVKSMSASPAPDSETSSRRTRAVSKSSPTWNNSSLTASYSSVSTCQAPKATPTEKPSKGVDLPRAVTPSKSPEPKAKSGCCIIV